MIVEQRTYDLYPGRVAEFTRLIETEGIAIQRPILGRLIRGTSRATSAR
jgi:hypothetical protein